MTVYPDNFKTVSEKCIAVGFHGLTEQEKVVYCIWWLEGELDNGGFHQFLFNSSGDYGAETLKALNAIGATKTRDLLERAFKISFGGVLPEDIDERRDTLDALDDGSLDSLDELDSEFRANEEKIEKLVNDYIVTKGT